MYKKRFSGDVRTRRLQFEQLETKALLTSFVDFPQTFVPIQDAYLDDGTRVDTTQLAVGNNSTQKESHLTFDVAGFAGQQIHSAKLRLQVANDAAFADLALYEGSAAQWTERYLSNATAPVQTSLLDGVSGPLTNGDWVEFDVSNAIQADGIVNFVLVSVAAANDVMFTSREGIAAPELIVVSTAAAFDGDANGDFDADGGDFLSWQRSFGTSNIQTDWNSSGSVDAVDLGLWQGNFGTSTLAVTVGNVTDYGGTPDDTTFDEVAIQAAIDNHASVFLPAGEYRINAKLVIPAGRHLYGPSTGTPATIRVVHDTGTVQGNFAVEVVGDGVTIQDLVIDKDFVDGSYGVGIFATNQDFLTFSGLEIRDFSVRYGIHIIESNVFEINNVYVHDFMMNQSFANGIGADMIQDSPAGIRITRSVNGSIRDSRVHDIEVGPIGRASISQLVPSYGPQGYQSDAITLSDSSDIDVEGNELWNSGELIDPVASDNIFIRNNTLQMSYLIGVKMIGVQDSIVQGNYIADSAVGIWMGDHVQTGEQATGNLIDNNDIVNASSFGIYNEAAISRFSNATKGIFVDDNADGSTISNNSVYDSLGFLTEFVRQGAGSNTFTNNNGITTEFGPSGGEDAQILGAWTSGLTHASKNLGLNQDIGLNRALVFFTYAEDAADNVATTAVTYGGRSLTKLNDRLVAGATSRVYVSGWILTQDDINMATDGDFAVTWNMTPDSVGYSSVFLENIDQLAPLFSDDSGPALSGNTVGTSPRATDIGGILLYGATAANTGDFSPNNGLTEALEIAVTGADAASGYKPTTGADEAASVTHTNLGVGVMEMFNLRRNPLVSPAAVSTIDISTIGAHPDDGLNDPFILQNVLDNSSFDDIYFPPGTYNFNQTIFVPSNKTIRGDSAATTHFETLSDVTLFRFNNNTTNSTLANFSVERPQTQDSDNEIIRMDFTSNITIDSLEITNSASRAPIILSQDGNNNTVIGNRIVDYQVVRDEPSPEAPGLHTQVFGHGITFTRETDLTVAKNEVIQNVVLNFGTPVIKGVYQATAIEVIVGNRGSVIENYVFRSGQGIDTGLSTLLQVSDNVIDEIHSAGIKLVNGSNNITVEDNYVRNAGLTGIWLGSGVAGNGGSFDNIIRNNTLVGIGKGIGLDFWDFNFGLTTPAAIHLQAAQLDTDRVRNNLIIDNNSYDNDEQRGIVMAEPGNGSTPFEPINNTITNNIEQILNAPEPPFT